MCIFDIFGFSQNVIENILAYVIFIFYPFNILNCSQIENDKEKKLKFPGNVDVILFRTKAMK